MLRRKVLDAPEWLAAAVALGYRAAMSTSRGLFVSLLLVATGSAAMALPANPCRADVARLCADVTPGEGRVRDCLRAHAKELSPRCRTWFRTRVTSPDAGRLDAKGMSACRGDVARFCQGIPSGGGRWRRCLQDRAAELSEGCRAMLDASAAPPGTPQK
jgi:hypothetical protein